MIKKQRACEYRLLDKLFDELFPILRSITGPGIEKSMDILGQYMPLDKLKVASGTKVFDWVTPQAWNCRAATLIAPDGTTVCDMKNSNLHVLNYSEPVNKTLSLGELQKHLHSIECLPEAIPYVTSYYHRTWGFCISHAERLRLKEGNYQAIIDSEFSDGHIPLAHSILSGETEREIVIASYLCHPSLANNELSGPLVLIALYDRISKWANRMHRFRFVLNPETIGSLCYLHLYGDQLRVSMDAGIVLTCVGGAGPLSFKQSRLKDTQINRLADLWADRGGIDGRSLDVRPFSPASGSDERQWCSPGFNLPMGQFARSVYGEYAGYHNSLDTKEFMGIQTLLDSVDQIEQFLSELDRAGPWINQSPFGEPQLGKRGLYPNVNSANTWMSSNDQVFDGRKILARLLNVLSYSDGVIDLVEIADKCNCSVTDLLPIVSRLCEENLLAYGGVKK
jgi:aminopeptidase-like protein